MKDNGEIVPLMKMGKDRIEGTFFRNTSCVGEPDANALDSLKNGDMQLLSDLINENVIDINKPYEDEKHKTLLHIAVELDNAYAVSLILGARAKVNTINRVLNTAPIHVAARKGNPEIFGMLLVYGADINSQTSDGKTPLHILARKIVSDQDGSHYHCFRMSLNTNICKIEIREKTDDLTPLEIACKETRYEPVIRVLVSFGADVSRCKDVVEDILGKDYQKLVVPGLLNKDDKDIDGDLTNLLHLANARDLDNSKEFKEKLNQVSSVVDIMVAPPGRLNLLQLAAKYGLHNHVKELLIMPNMNPNICSSGTIPALLLAANQGHFKVIDAFLCHHTDETMFIILDDKGSSILHHILRKPGQDHAKCFEIVKNVINIKKIINRQDVLGNTALHYATQFWSQEVARVLLDLGANIGIKNVYNEVPIAHILPETMEAFLNETCLTSVGNVTNDNFKITSDFSFLVSEQISERAMTQDKDPEQGSGEIYLPETDGLWYMGQSKKHQHLLKHPVVDIFLQLKWNRMSGVYNANLTVYALFVAIVTTYIFLLYAGNEIRISCDQGGLPSLPTGVWYVLLILTCLLGIRELLQFGVTPKRYIFGVENWIEITIIILTSYLLGNPACHDINNRHVAAIVIVLSWAELITMIGRHPKFTSLNIYVTMLYKVLKTFILFLIWYSLFIIAFALGFYILLHQDHQVGDEEQEYKFFNSLDLTVVKTFTMFVGELEFGDLPITSITGYIFLLTFVFLIVVVMMNLLNGLAVSDTGAIWVEAATYANKCQLETISYLEAMLLGDPFHFLSSWPSYLWLRHLNCSPLGGLYRVPPIRKLFNVITNAKKITVLSEGVTSITFYPNRNTVTCFDGCIRGTDGDGFSLPKEIMESAKDVVVETRKNTEQITLEDRMSKMEDILNKILEKMN